MVIPPGRPFRRLTDDGALMRNENIDGRLHGPQPDPDKQDSIFLRLIYMLLIYLMIGYVNGLFSETYFDEDIKLPLLLIAGSEFVYGLLIYFLMFMLRGEFDFVYYLMHVIIPELIYTVGVTLILYQLILWINQKLEAEEKRSASKFV